MAQSQREMTELARLRRRVIQELHAGGLSYAQIADAAGLSRGRIYQLRHAGPAPRARFWAPARSASPRR
jgi:DNA-directed RNA polymerase specialized sigma24 family protein